MLGYGHDADAYFTHRTNNTARRTDGLPPIPRSALIYATRIVSCMVPVGTENEVAESRVFRERALFQNLPHAAASVGVRLMEEMAVDRGHCGARPRLVFVPSRVFTRKASHRRRTGSRVLAGTRGPRFGRSRSFALAVSRTRHLPPPHSHCAIRCMRRHGRPAHLFLRHLAVGGGAASPPPAVGQAARALAACTGTRVAGCVGTHAWRRRGGGSLAPPSMGVHVHFQRPRWRCGRWVYIRRAASSNAPASHRPLLRGSYVSRKPAWVLGYR